VPPAGISSPFSSSTARTDSRVSSRSGGNPCVVDDRLAQSQPLPRRGEIGPASLPGELLPAQEAACPLGQTGEKLLGEVHHLPVVGIGPSRTPAS